MISYSFKKLLTDFPSSVKLLKLSEMRQAIFKLTTISIQNLYRTFYKTKSLKKTTVQALYVDLFLYFLWTHRPSLTEIYI